MAIELWNIKEHVKILPPIDLLTRMGRRGWDTGIEFKLPDNETLADKRAVFSMPNFGRQGRWGNMVFQYLFIQVLSLNNNRDIELFRSVNWINNRICLYEDMLAIPHVQTKSSAILITDYESQPGYIPTNLWRVMYVSSTLLKKCFLLKNIIAATHNPLPLIENDHCVELEGAFILKSYNQQNREFILTRLFKPVEEFGTFLQNCLENFGLDKTIIGIHIRRGDTAQNPLGQQFDLPIPTKYFMAWLEVNLPLLKNPVLYISSDDPNAYKEFEVAGVEVFYLTKLLPKDDMSLKYEKYEQVDWEIMRRCDVLLTSNSTFSFSAALLSIKTPDCYRFLVSKKAFELFDPWQNNPLQIYSFSKYLWTTLYSRFRLVFQMVSFRMACYRVVKDLIFWIYWKKSKIKYLYYLHGFSLKYFGKIFNLLELFQVPKRNRPTNY